MPQISIPQPLKSDINVTVNLPPEVTQLMKDLHADRDGIAAGGIVLIACVVLCTIKKLCNKS